MIGATTIIKTIWGLKKPKYTFSGSVIHKDYRCKGYASEARYALLHHLKNNKPINSVYFATSVDNIAMNNLMKKLGADKLYVYENHNFYRIKLQSFNKHFMLKK